MTQIRILAPEVAHKIAAGEVIERPASVVKELVENSIDAQATQITVEIRQGGIEFIRVQDNGVGIAKDELDLAFQPHATSKIGNAEDLFSLFTLGFRGEALPSMASISKLSMYSRPEGQEHGYKISPQDGEFEIVPVGTPPGTTVEVKDLFYNVPARLKFLKSASAERRRILDIGTKLALAHPHTAFRIVAENKTVLVTPGNGRLLDAILLVEGNNIANDLIKFQESFAWGSVQGYLGKPRLAKGNRSGQLFVMNGRVIQSQTLRASLEKAYAGLLASRTFPWAILILDLNPNLVDCNVHPAKAEVRFADEQVIFTDVLQTARSALIGINLAPKLTQDVPELKLSSRPLSPVQAQLRWEPSSWEQMDQILKEYKPQQRSNPTVKQPKFTPIENTLVQETTPNLSSTNTSQDLEDTRKALLTGRILGQLQQMYILLEVPTGLWILDQHIVHERILFEELEEAWESENIHIQEIIPQSFDFTPSEAQLVLDSLEHLRRFGLELEEFGNNSFLLRSVPTSLADSGGSWKKEIIQVAETAKKTSDWKKDSLITLACRGSVKAGDYLDPQMMKALLADLAKTKNPFTCPHGRPIIVRLENQELLRRFGRI